MSAVAVAVLSAACSDAAPGPDARAVDPTIDTESTDGPGNAAGGAGSAAEVAGGTAPDAPGSAAPGCDATAAAGTAIAETADLAARQGGGVVCVVGDRPEERTVLTAGGSADRPLVLRAQGRVRTAGFVVRADHVVVEGFTVSTSSRRPDEDDGAGIVLEGRELVVRANVVEDTAFHGILCSERGVQCVGARIADNVVRGADGSGIVVHGSDVVVTGNDVSASVMTRGDDADGVRFFGTGHVIVGNRVHDLSIRSRPVTSEAEFPHVDCFQTFDIRGFAVEDVLIARNLCLGADNMCLIATAGRSTTGTTTPPRSRGLQFRDNVCQVSGAQAILLDGMEATVVANNLVTTGAEFYGVAAVDSPGTRVLNNVFEGPAWPYWSSGPAVSADGNLVLGADAVTAPTWQEPLDRWLVGATTTPRSDAGCPVAGSSAAVVDRGVPVPPLPARAADALAAAAGATIDLAGSARVTDGDGDGTATIDIGPIETASSETRSTAGTGDGLLAPAACR